MIWMIHYWLDVNLDTHGWKTQIQRISWLECPDSSQPWLSTSLGLKIGRPQFPKDCHHHLPDGSLGVYSIFRHIVCRLKGPEMIRNPCCSALRKLSSPNWYQETVVSYGEEMKVNHNHWFHVIPVYGSFFELIPFRYQSMAAWLRPAFVVLASASFQGFLQLPEENRLISL